MVTGIKVDGGVSSQVLTGLLLALPKVKEAIVINVFDLQSKPYIDMTLQIMNDFGVQIIHDNYKCFKIDGNQCYTGQEYEIEGDWSGAAFHLVGGAISSSVQLKGINIDSTQADKKVLEAL
jgi:3-phosphoshikimate 1-carboxyvinyltransferase